MSPISSEPGAGLVVVGQGYVGLPIAVCAVGVGYNVVGVDVDKLRAARPNAADSYVEDVPAATVRACLDTRRFTATTVVSTSSKADLTQLARIATDVPIDRSEFAHVGPTASRR